jgi:glycine C-acetyltransferase
MERLGKYHLPWRIFMNKGFYDEFNKKVEEVKKAGTFKYLTHIRTPMSSQVEMQESGETIILSSNNYLGLSDNPNVIQAGIDGLKRLGAGTASVRFICGTFDIHSELEQTIASFLGREASISYVACWNANTGAIPVLAEKGDAIISDELNHASIIDGVRLSKADRYVYKHSDMDSLRAQLEQSQTARRRLIITDGVFSMEGDIAKLPEIVALAKEYDAIVYMDDSHSTGVLGAKGKGTEEYYGMEGEVDVIASTLGKALGGAAGGFIASSQSVIDMLHQMSRPQIFSNALPPTVAASSKAAIEELEKHPEMVQRLHDNASYIRTGLKNMGFKPLESDTGIIPIIVGDTAFAIKMSKMLLEEHIFVTGFGFPVVPEGTARVRVQASAALTKDQMDKALVAFEKVGKELNLI